MDRRGRGRKKRRGKIETGKGKLRKMREGEKMEDGEKEQEREKCDNVRVGEEGKERNSDKREVEEVREEREQRTKEGGREKRKR